MPASTRWSVKVQTGRPIGILLTGVVLALVASAATGVSVWMQGGASVAVLATVLLTLIVLAGFLRARRRGAAPVYLFADAQGSWSLCENRTWRAVRPSRIWRGPYWITLALKSPDGAGRMATLTVWRSALPTQDWRKLCVLLRARPVRAARGTASRTKEAA